MRMIPSILQRDLAGGIVSRAEQRVFESLKLFNAGEHSVAYHSLNLPDHEYKLLAELDFVIVSALGILVLEVKGGGVSCSETTGIWSTEDRFGVSHRLREDPFSQARTGMYALRDRLNKLRPGKLNDVPLGYGVIFPDCAFTLDPLLEWDPVILLDAPRFRSEEGLKTYLRNLYNYWRGKHKISSTVDVETLRRIHDVARPSFEMVPNLHTRAQAVGARQEELTRDQYSYIDTFDANRRVLCSGGAGSGKTFLALETARRAAIRGGDILLVCKNPSLASFLQKSIGDENIRAATVNQLDSQPDGKPQADLLIVDEGQDILNIPDLDILDRNLKDGLQEGNWAIFYDRNNQSGIYGSFDQDALDLLESYHAVNIRLTRNCRNTQPIVIQTKLTTGADLGTASAGPGPEVGYGYYTSKNDAAAALAARLRLWREEEIPPGEITVLSPVNWKDSCVQRLDPAEKNLIMPLEGDFGSNFPVSQTTFCDIAGFKGFENGFIAFIDLEDVESLGEGLSSMYVGMTRARAGLWISMNKALEPYVGELQMKNINAINFEEAKPYD